MFSLSSDSIVFELSFSSFLLIKLMHFIEEWPISTRNEIVRRTEYRSSRCAWQAFLLIKEKYAIVQIIFFHV